MKRILLSSLVIATMFLGACSAPPTTPKTPQSPWPNVDVHIDVNNPIYASVNQTFVVGPLFAIPRIGRHWYETHNESTIALVNSTFVNNAPPFDGNWWFLFKGLKPGETEITFTYRSDMSPPPIIEQQVFIVELK